MTEHIPFWKMWENEGKNVWKMWNFICLTSWELMDKQLEIPFEEYKDRQLEIPFEKIEKELYEDLITPEQVGKLLDTECQSNKGCGL